jgi:RNA polymerase sigma factor (sigma-70 family)
MEVGMINNVEKDHFKFKHKKELVDLSKTGDIQSFTILFNYNKPALYAKALQFFGSSPEAKDVVQDTYIRAFSNISQLRDPGKVNSWLHSILKNECLLIKRRKEKILNGASDLDRGLSDKSIQTSDVESQLENREFHQGIMQLLSCLDEKKQATILLRFFSEFHSYQEISKVLDIPIGTVRSRIAKAKEELRLIIDNIGIDELYLPGNVQLEQEERFREAWPSFYQGNRDHFLNLFKKDLSLRFSSGKICRGLKRWEQEWDIDLDSGVRFMPNSVINSNKLVIVEGPIINPPETPNHCPPFGSMVLFHHHGMVHRAHIHYASPAK